MSRFAGLRQRLITALALALALLLVLFVLPPVATFALIVIAMLAGAWEWSAFLHPSRRSVRIVYVVLVAVGLFAAHGLATEETALSRLLGLAVIFWLAALLWIVVAPARGGAASAAVAGVFALIPTGVALVRLRETGEGPWVLLFGLVVVMAADVGAYFVGHRFGRTKLAPQVSPGKTWEGAIGGVLAALLVGFFGASALGWAPSLVLPLAAAAAAFSIVGDLTESLMKRHTGLKDSGRLFPGHGGVLDRLDSLSAGVPVFALGLLKAGLLGVGE